MTFENSSNGTLRLNLQNLPDHVICIGAQRSGTTWLYNNLMQSPEVSQPRMKEVDYFRDLGNFTYGPKWYLEQLQSGQGKLTVDITPEYAIDPLSLKRMKEMVPHAKIIFIIRDPIERIKSAYQKFVFDGFANLSFSRFLKYNYDTAIGRSQYLECARFLDENFENVLVIDYADINKSPLDVWEIVCSFLDIRHFSPNTSKQNASKKKGLATKLFGAVSRTLEQSEKGRNLKAKLVNQPLVTKLYATLIQTKKTFSIDDADLEKMKLILGDDYALTRDRYAKKVSIK